MSVEIRSARIEDIPGAYSCLDGVARERKYVAVLEAPPIDQARLYWQALIDKALPFCVAVEQDRAVGWCDVTPLPRPTLAHGGILGMGLLPDYRGRGIGRRLLGATIDEARRCGLERIELTVLSSNDPARRLYKSLDFAEEGLLRRYWKADGRYEDAVLMALLL